MMITYRRIEPDDVPAVLEFVIEGLRPERCAGLVFSRWKTEGMVRHFERSQTDFHLAAFDKGGRVVGALAAAVSEMAFFERSEAHVYVLYATVPGVGREMVRQMLNWVKHHPMVRRVVWAQNADADPRTPLFAERRARAARMERQGLAMQVFTKV